MQKLHPFLIIIIFSLLTSSCGGDSSNEDMALTENIQENPDSEQGNGGESTTSYANAVEEHGQLHIEGTHIVDKNGNTIQLRGMSLFWSQWIGKYYNANAVAWLKNDWQCNVIRAAMAIDYDGYLVNPEVEKTKIKTVIDAAIAEGIYVVVDWHDHEAQDHLENAKSFFAEIAQMYGDKPNIIYETYNEPLDVSWNSVLKPYHEAVIAEIRQYDPDNIIVCGTRNWSQNVEDVIGNKIDDPNVAYTLHYYAATHKQWLRDKARTAIINNIPLFFTEFGTTQASGNDEINEIESNLWWNFLDENKISWCNWSVADKDELSAALIPGASANGNWANTVITTSGTMVRNELKSKNKSY